MFHTLRGTHHLPEGPCPQQLRGVSEAQVPQADPPRLPSEPNQPPRIEDKTRQQQRDARRADAQRQLPGVHALPAHLDGLRLARALAGGVGDAARARAEVTGAVAGDDPDQEGRVVGLQ
jgi:hypothetical protein